MSDEPTAPPPAASDNRTVEGREAVVLAIDPGSAKCGVAVVAQNGAVRFRAIMDALRVVEMARELIAAHRPVAFLVGAGTGSKPLLRALEAAQLDLPVQRVDESHTSELARARFVAENAPVGWQRLVPRTLRTPWRPYDDYVAIILAERYWQEREKVSQSPNPPAPFPTEEGGD